MSANPSRALGLPLAFRRPSSFYWSHSERAEKYHYYHHYSIIALDMNQNGFQCPLSIHLYGRYGNSPASIFHSFRDSHRSEWGEPWACARSSLFILHLNAESAGCHPRKDGGLGTPSLEVWVPELSTLLSTQNTGADNDWTVRRIFIFTLCNLRGRRLSLPPLLHFCSSRMLHAVAKSKVNTKIYCHIDIWSIINGVFHNKKF